MESFLKTVGGHEVRFIPKYAEDEMEVRYNVEIGPGSYRMQLVDDNFRFEVLEGLPKEVIDLEQQLSDAIMSFDK